MEVSSNIEKEFYLSCLVDRATSKIAFITSDQGGMDIEEVAAKSPNKILTTKVELNEEISNESLFAVQLVLWHCDCEVNLIQSTSDFSLLA